MSDLYSRGVDLLEQYHSAMDRGDSIRRGEIFAELVSLNLMKELQDRIYSWIVEEMFDA